MLKMGGGGGGAKRWGWVTSLRQAIFPFYSPPLPVINDRSLERDAGRGKGPTVNRKMPVGRATRGKQGGAVRVRSGRGRTSRQEG